MSPRFMIVVVAAGLARCGSSDTILQREDTASTPVPDSGEEGDDADTAAAADETPGPGADAVASEHDGESTDKPPAVAITAPDDVTGDVYVHGLVTVTAAATDDVGVAAVEFFAGAVSFGKATAEPYSAQLDTDPLDEGPVTLMARATDTTGQATEDHRQVTVDRTPPAIELTAPDEDATVTGSSLTVTAKATDNFVVRTVAFSLAGGAVVTVESAPWSADLDLTGASAGPLVVHALATDGAGLTAEATVTVTLCTTGCACTPDCAGKDCGDNGCGGSCGQCAQGETCTASGHCDAATTDTCGTEVPGGAPIGAECAEDSDCATGYCYDEKLWNEDGDLVHRFCTVACTGCTLKTNCNQWPKATGVDNKCIPLPSYFIKFHSLQFESLCLASCSSDADCSELGSFSKCAKLALGKDSAYGVFKICQPVSFVQLPAEDYP